MSGAHRRTALLLLCAAVPRDLLGQPALVVDVPAGLSQRGLGDDEESVVAAAGSAAGRVVGQDPEPAVRAHDDVAGRP